MDTFETWPPAVIEALRDIAGAPLAVERLGGMSPAATFRVSVAAGSVVVKASPSPRETLLYEHAGEPLRRAGVSMPARLWSAHLDGRHWLVMEDIREPAPMPHRDLWSPDPRMAATLARIHALPLSLPEALERIDEPGWTDATTDVALSFFAPEVGEALATPLRALQAEGQHILERWCWIQGDPNPSNWGLRADGTPVVYDWERVRRGTPATDLAILVMGNGDPPKYDALAECYLREWEAMTDAPPWSAERLARDIALAKVWATVGFLRTCVIGRGRVPERLRGQLAEFVPPWVHEIANARPR